MTEKQAIFLTALAFLAAMVGLVLSKYSEEVVMWLSAWRDVLVVLLAYLLGKYEHLSAPPITRLINRIGGDR